MKHPVKEDFETAVTEAGMVVTFKPMNSIYSFYRLTESEDIACLGPVSLERVRHAGPSEVQQMAQRIASEIAPSVWSVQDEQEVDRSTLRRYSVGGNDDVTE